MTDKTNDDDITRLIQEVETARQEFIRRQIDAWNEGQAISRRYIPALTSALKSQAEYITELGAENERVKEEASQMTIRAWNQAALEQERADTAQQREARLREDVLQYAEGTAPADNSDVQQLVQKLWKLWGDGLKKVVRAALSETTQDGRL